MKKIIALTLVLALALSLAACGNGGSTTAEKKYIEEFSLDFAPGYDTGREGNHKFDIAVSEPSVVYAEDEYGDGYYSFVVDMKITNTSEEEDDPGYAFNISAYQGGDYSLSVSDLEDENGDLAFNFYEMQSLDPGETGECTLAWYIYEGDTTPVTVKLTEALAYEPLYEFTLDVPEDFTVAEGAQAE